ncbi:DUF4174 domain-containing protein, partial [Klebsiella pneumoniae]|uniref:DUF4174 domain-containing protein n=1 Tax=Klebsiella pneumoniae TaxID=573 RepID=UPI0019D3375D
PETNALIRALKLGVGSGTKVILIGKDGEKKLEKTVPPDSLDLKEFFSAIDQMPQAEKELAAPAEPEPVPAAPAALPVRQSAFPTLQYAPLKQRPRYAPLGSPLRS